MPLGQDIKIFGPNNEVTDLSTTAGAPEKKADDSAAKLGKVSADLDPEAIERILAYREQVKRARELNEAELYDTGLSQCQIIEALAEEILDKLIVESTNELDAALDGVSRGVFMQA